MELKKYRLSDVATVELSNVDKKTKEGEASVRLCNFTDVYYNWAVTKDMTSTFMEASASDKQIERFSLKKGQVALTKDSETRYDIGIPTYIADDFDDVILGYHCALITPDESKVSGKYLNAFMNSPYIHKYFANSASGSGQRYALSVETLESMPLLLPSLEEQKRIDKIFSYIDRKISLNRAINQNLEALAKQIYDYWFVQFDFPDENGRPYKSSGGKMVWNEDINFPIPYNWCGSKLKMIANYVSDKIPVLKMEKNKYVSTENLLPNRQGLLGVANLPKVNSVTKCRKGDTLISNIRPYFKKIFFCPSDGFGCSSDVLCLRAKEEINEFFLFGLLAQDVFFDYVMSGSKGSKMPRGDKEQILNYGIVVPNKKIVESYNKIIRPIMSIINGNREQINSLVKQRDELLPFLMNGQVTIE